MTVIALTSAKGSPGVTTAAVGLALVWPKPVLLVEADVSGSSSILAGYYAGRVRHDRGLVDLAAAHREGRLAAAMREYSIALGERGNARMLPGLTSPAQAGTMTHLWEPIAAVLRGMDSTGVDVIVDAGRLGIIGSPLPLMREADITLLTTRTDLPAIAATRARAGGLREDLVAKGVGEDALWLLLVGEGRPFPSRDAKARIGLPVASSIEWDPTAASVISQGLAPANMHRYSEKKFESSGFNRSIRTTAASIEAIIRGRRDQLSPDGLLEKIRGGDHRV